MKSMFKKLLIVVIAFLPFMAHSKCASRGLYFWPYDDTVKTNSVFMIEGYALSKKIIKGLNSTYPVYLASGSEKIKLNIKDTLVSQYGLMQAILIPETKLKAGKVYTLCIDHVPAEEGVSRWNSKTNGYDAVKWTVSAGEDHEAPVWASQPVIKKKEIIHYGCGPGANVIFSCKVKESSEFLVKTTLVSKRTGEKYVYYIPTREEDLYVGHDMCSGAFVFTEKAYTISFDLMDASGNYTAWKGEKIAFTGPEEKDAR